MWGYIYLKFLEIFMSGKYRELKKKLSLNNVFFLILLSFFILFAVFFALNTDKGIVPDENHHFPLSEIYSETIGIPSNSEETHRFADVTRQPFLYYWINGRILNINIWGNNKLIVLRLISVFYSAITIVLTYLLSKEIIKNKWFALLPVFFLVNTLMFVFLSSGVNYDNLLNLFAVGSTLFLVRYFKDKSSRNLLLWLFFVLASMLTKFTILPLVFIQVSLFLFDLFKTKVFPKIEKTGLVNIALIFTLSLLFVANISVYGVNLFRYKKFIPLCTQVLTSEQCMHNGIFKRDSQLPVLHIRSREGIRQILTNRDNPFEYTFKWIQEMCIKTYGIYGAFSIRITRWHAFLYISYFIFIFGIIISKYNRKKSSKNIFVKTLLTTAGVLIFICGCVGTFLYYFPTGWFALR